jgi:OOP family OmpA-OmpF porin
MEKKYLKALVFLTAAVFTVISCAAQKPATQKTGPAFMAVDLNPKLRAGQYVQKVDNFLVILDASGTMTESFKDQAKLALAKGFVSHMNQTIPDLRLTAALRTFGEGFSESTDIVYGPTDYTRPALEEALGKVTGGGFSPLGGAVNAASNDLKPTQGNIAVIVVSDGQETDNAGLQAAQGMKGQYGDRVCIYPVLVGDDPAGQSLLEQIARIGECGFMVRADEVLASEQMADYVEKVFLSTSQLSDSDGDGVTDDLDRCPNTPRGVKVDAKGCPLDTDGDGVYDYLDRCPGTPKGVKVDNRGCPPDTDGDGVYDYLDRCPGTPVGAKVDARGCWVLKGVRFDTNTSYIKPQFYGILDEAAAVLKRNPSLKIEIQGHTDSVGTAQYNRELSEKRAQSVMEYFVKKGIEKERLSSIGYGLTQPIASNLTPEGRAKNRRVELTPLR